MENKKNKKKKKVSSSPTGIKNYVCELGEKLPDFVSNSIKQSGYVCPLGEKLPDFVSKYKTE